VRGIVRVKHNTSGGGSSSSSSSTVRADLVAAGAFWAWAGLAGAGLADPGNENLNGEPFSSFLEPLDFWG
jgi:hypothetical protein